jgi:hypothetical protein
MAVTIGENDRMGSEDRFRKNQTIRNGKESKVTEREGDPGTPRVRHKNNH